MRRNARALVLSVAVASLCAARIAAAGSEHAGFRLARRAGNRAVALAQFPAAAGAGLRRRRV
jgi:hypothetical protein